MSILFSGKTHPLSNFYRVAQPYTVTVAPYGEFIIQNSEHHFMILKAAHFNDTVALRQLRNCKTPKDAKAIGRSVSGYSDDVWHKTHKANSQYTLAEEYMFQALLAKYEHCPEYQRQIQENLDKEFVEASPWDSIWGIGLSEEQAWATPRDNWGKNWLGKAHMRVAKAKSP